MKRKRRHTFIEKATGAVLDSYAIRDEDDQLLPRVGDTIEHRGQPWTIVDILPVIPAVEDPDHAEAAVEILCEPIHAKTNDGEPPADPDA